MKDWIEEWSFKGFKTDLYTHKIHKYPAMFIPQVVRKLITLYSKEQDTVLDIFNGSGTTLVECNLLNRKSLGIELNPLAVLISKVKITPVSVSCLYESLQYIKNTFFNTNYPFAIRTFKNIDYWYSPYMIECLSKLTHIINNINSVDVSDFFKVCLSEILREVSWCKHSGFKMHRDSKKIEKDISNFELFTKFEHVSLSNIRSMDTYSNAVSTNQAKLYNHNSTLQHSDIKPNSVDLIITSPPYGDSQTTVAYGQYSRLSMQWLDITPSTGSVINLDKFLLGGQPKKDADYSNILKQSSTLHSAYMYYSSTINTGVEASKIRSRLECILAFYQDLYAALKNANIYLKPNKYFILVTGSRVVLNYKLHTDIIVSEFAEQLNFKTVSVFYRNIENKRMPNKVSATNIAGEVAPTMTKESIVILKKI